MNQKKFPTPESISIKSREFDVDLSGDIPRYWNNNDPIKTHFLNSFSVVLPEFEKFFIAAVFRARAKINDKKMQEDIKNFCTQEGAHARIHRKYNQLLSNQGYANIWKYEKYLGEFLGYMQKRLSLNALLAITAGGEHITSFMGHDFLAHPEKWSRNSHATMNAIWRWHAIEEIEHKAVCYDTFEYLCGKRWLRIMALILINVPTVIFVTLIQISLLKKDGLLLQPKTWKNYFLFMFGAQGFMWSVCREYLKYFQKDFHPWQNDDHGLIEVEA
jgi:hypothetical protein